MRKIDFSSSGWKMQLYEYTEELVRNTDKFRGVSEYDLEDIIQDIYLYMLRYSSRRIDTLGSVSFNRDMGNWSRYIRVAVDAYDVGNLYCKKIYCSGYSYIDDSTLLNKDVIRSLKERVRYRNCGDTYCVQEYFLQGRSQRDIARELGISQARVQQRISHELRRLTKVASRMYDYGDWGEMRE